MIDGKIKWGNCRIKKNKVQFQILNEKYKDTLVIAENEISTNLYFLWKIS